ncbi:ABC transporter substrate-binding protein, partial [Streptomyces sp. SID8455]|nr:ABC transporter substrate-binding protein [Streptomyces sp. SID8455]
VLTLAGCADNGPQGSAGAQLNLATLTSPQSLDPSQAVGSALPFFQAVYDTLVKREADGDFSPMLATEWTYDDTRTALALTLRDDVKFA